MSVWNILIRTAVVLQIAASQVRFVHEVVVLGLEDLEVDVLNRRANKTMYGRIVRKVGGGLSVPIRMGQGITTKLSPALHQEVRRHTNAVRERIHGRF